jgi:hypothetical protein
MWQNDKLFFFFNLRGGTLGTATTTGLLYQPRMMGEGDSGEIGGMKIGRGAEVLGENLPQRQFCPSQNPTWLDPVLNPGCRGGKPATNRLSYGAAMASPWLSRYGLFVLFPYIRDTYKTPILGKPTTFYQCANQDSLRTTEGRFLDILRHSRLLLAHIQLYPTRITFLGGGGKLSFRFLHSVGKW